MTISLNLKINSMITMMTTRIKLFLIKAMNKAQRKSGIISEKVVQAKNWKKVVRLKIKRKRSRKTSIKRTKRTNQPSMSMMIDLSIVIKDKDWLKWKIWKEKNTFKSFPTSLIKVDLLDKKFFHTNQKPLKNVLTKPLLIWSFNRNSLNVHKMIHLEVEFKDESMAKEGPFSTINS